MRKSGWGGMLSIHVHNICVQKARVEINRKITYMEKICIFRKCRTSEGEKAMTINQIELGKAIALLELAQEKRLELYKSREYAEYAQTAHKAFAAFRKSGVTPPEEMKVLVERVHHSVPAPGTIVYTSEVGTLLRIAKEVEK